VILIPAAVAPRLEAPLCTSLHCPDRMTIWTGCTSPVCVGWCCECGEGCDIDTRPDSGLCATATDAGEEA
jgi:hypothetical protein